MGYLRSLKVLPHKMLNYKADATLIKLASPVTRQTEVMCHLIGYTENMPSLL